MSDMAKVFWNAGGQAVQLPDGYELDGGHVRIGREGDRIYLDLADGQHVGNHEEISARKLAELRALVQEGLDSGPDEPWDLEEIKRFAREGR